MNDYHDYVFRDGKLVGEFDEMYRRARDVPWHQDRISHSWQADAAIAAIATHAPYDGVLEIGCGLGYFAERLAQFGPADAFDISPEAVRRASMRTDRVRFFVDDIRRADFVPPRRYGLVVLRDVLWYVCDHIDQVMSNVDRSIAEGGHVAVVQSFPRLDRSFVGRDVIAGPQALFDRFGRYRLLHSAILQNHEVVDEGPTCVVLGVR